MLVTTKAIVISKLKYKEHDLIVKCYTQKYGVKSYLLRGILKSRKGKLKTAYFQLLSQIEMQATHRENRGLQSINEVKITTHYQSIYNNVAKGAIVMFLSEILSSILKEEEQNATLFEYIETALLWLDSQDEFSNFHLLFLMQLTKHLGFYPDTKQIHLDYFNLEEGRFQDKKTNNYCISNENLILLKALLGIKFDALQTLKISASQRQAFLSMILLYFELHLGSLKKPKSLEVLNQVFS